LLEEAIIVTDRALLEAQVNRSLDDAIELMQAEVERLKASLETCRRLDHPRRGELVRWHVLRLDQREDALAQLQAMLLARRTPADPIH
jgi:hypothetical protein